jgi:hypothetical protein
MSWAATSSRVHIWMPRAAGESATASSFRVGPSGTPLAYPLRSGPLNRPRHRLTAQLTQVWLTWAAPRADPHWGLPMGVKKPALIAAYMFDGQDNEVVKHDVEREQT